MIRIETWNQGRGVFSLPKISGTDLFLVHTLHGENSGKREVLRVHTYPDNIEELEPLLPDSFETIGGKVEGKFPFPDLLREICEEASWMKNVTYDSQSQVLLPEGTTCYQSRMGKENGEWKLNAFLLSAHVFFYKAAYVQSLIESGKERVVTVEDVVKNRVVLRPYQAAIFRMIAQGNICIPTP